LFICGNNLFGPKTSMPSSTLVESPSARAKWTWMSRVSYTINAEWEARKLSIYYRGNTDINKYSLGAIILEQANRTREYVSTQQEADNWSRQDGSAVENRFEVGREVVYKEVYFGITIIAEELGIMSTANSGITSYH
jgi:hypothetical protein